MTLAERIHTHLLNLNVPIIVGDMPNIVYLQDSDAEGNPIEGQTDRWDDRRILLHVDEWGVPTILINVAATTTAGWASIAKARTLKKGVARIIPGHHAGVWRYGYHKGDKMHPCLRQRDPIKVCRDWNWNGKMDEQLITEEVIGVNQHGARTHRMPTRVGYNSAGCLVGHIWQEHLLFIDLLTKNKVFGANRNFAFSATIIGAIELYAPNS